MGLTHRFARAGTPIVCAVFVAFLSCLNATRCHADEPKSGDTILFDVFYINYAWGFACGGWFIDASGAVHHYDCRALGDSIRTPAYRYREGTLLQRRFGMRDSIACRVDSSELAHAKQLAREAAEKPPLERREGGRDMGGRSYTAFLYDPVTGKRTEVPLATIGDWTRDPSTDAARELMTWLDTVCSRKDTTGR